MVALARVLAVLAAGTPAGSGASDSCYHYTPAAVALTGRLAQRTMPGPPNYESIARGDRPEVVMFLILDTPICTIGDYKDSPNSDAFPRQDTLQVRSTPATAPQLRRLIGSRVTIEGTLAEWALGRDRTPVLVDASAVRPASKS